MRIVCDNCGAKYSIADEKVAGKVFRIRCRKCSGVITVRGDAAAEEASGSVAEPTPSMPPGDSIWHVVVSGDQQGPFSPLQVGELLSAGTIDWEAYVWRDGFDDWQPARDVQELVDAVMAAAQTQNAASVAEQISISKMSPEEVATQLAAGEEPAADASPEEASPPDSDERSQYDDREDDDEGQTAVIPMSSVGLPGGVAAALAQAMAPAARASVTRDQGDLFGAPEEDASPFAGRGSDDDVIASIPSPQPSSVGEDLTGSRNENSVLFSLQSLQALATGAPAAPPKAGHAVGQGSGLIDIRALASAAQATSGPTSGAPAGRDKVEDLLSIGGTATPFASSLGAPVLAPPQAESNKRIGLVVGIAAAALIGVGGLGLASYMFMQKGEPQAVATNDIEPPTKEREAVPAVAAAPAVAAPVVAAPPPAAAAEAPVEPAATPAAVRSKVATARRSEGETEATRSAPAAAAPATPAAAPAGQRATTKRGTSDIDSLLDQAIGANARNNPAPRAAQDDNANLPETPPRDAVASALRSVETQVKGCSTGEHGMAMATVIVTGSTGRVSNVNVTGQFAGTPVGSCVARTVRGARFPRFKRETFQVTFPYRI